MIHLIRSRLSVKLSLLLSIVVIPSLAAVGVMLTIREVQVVENLVLKEAKTAALSGAAAYGVILDTGVDSGALTLDDVLSPAYEEMKFTDPAGSPIVPEDARYRTKVGTYVCAHGTQQLQDATMNAGGFLFASGMDRRGLVLCPHAPYDHPPRGTATPESTEWDRKHSRGQRMYTGPEQIAAAGFRGNRNATTLVQEYLRDTGESAWDVAAPIYVKGKHFGGFRVGVARDRVAQQYRDLAIGLTMLFGLLTVTLVGAVFWLSRRYIRPLSLLTDRVNTLSSSGDTSELAVRITSADESEVGEMARSVNRLRASLHAAMSRIDDLPKETPP